MLCRLHTVYKIIHCVALHTLCNITQSVSNHIVKWPIFCITSEKIYTCQKKITRAPPVAPVTNIRYAPQQMIHSDLLVSSEAGGGTGRSKP